LLGFFQKSFLGVALSGCFLFASLPALAQYSHQECQVEISKLREIYVVILRKIPLMPPLAQLSSGIQRALSDAEMSRDAGDFKRCIVNMRSQISVVQSYAN
jgi:hypothetical protein